MRIQLSEHFDYKKLLRFVLPSVVMIVFTLIYGVVDGLFISNFVGKSALTAINLIMPLLIIMGAIGFMIGTGGSALVAKTLGEKEPEKAHAYFSMLVICMVAAGLLLTVLGQLLLPKIASLLGAAGATYNYCVLYGRIVLSSARDAAGGWRVRRSRPPSARFSAACFPSCISCGATTAFYDSLSRYGT